MAAPGVTDIVSLLKECVTLAITMYEISQRISDIKNTLDEISTLIRRMEEKLSLFFETEPDNEKIKKIKEDISDDLGKIKQELVKSSELMKTNFKKYMKSKEISASLEDALNTARKCEIRLEAIAMNNDHIEKTNEILKYLKEFDLTPKSGKNDKMDQTTDQATRAIETVFKTSKSSSDGGEERFDIDENASMMLLEDLPKALQNIVDTIGKSGLNHEKMQNLALAINKYREVWNVDSRDIEFDKNVFGFPVYLGRGASGNVLSGKMSISIANSDEKKRFKVAIKEVHARASEYPTGEILREVLLQMSIRHDNILSTYGLCWMYHEADENSRGLIVMERMGHNLRKAISSKLIIDVSEKVRVLRDILEALIHLHENGVVHRDVKPENVLLNVRDKNIVGFAKLSDFGCSRKVAEETITRMRMTMMSSVASGTPLYSPPEVIMNPKIRTRKSWDVYSFGIVICYVFTGGKIPDFEVSEKSARSGALLENASKWARKVEDKKYQKIALRCLHKDEKNRPTMKQIKKFMDDDAELVDRKIIFSGSQDSTIRRWNASTGEPIGEPLKGHSDCVDAIAISASGDMIVSGSWDKTVRRWNSSTGEQIGEPLKGHAASVFAIAISPNGNMIVSASADRTIRRWNASTGEPIGEPLKGHTECVEAVAISRSGDMIVSGSYDNTTRRWNASTGEPIGEPLRGHTYSVDAMAISPSGDMIVSASADGTIRRWNASTGEQIGEPLRGHTDTVWAVAISASGDMIVSASGDDTIRRWNSSTGEQIGEPLKGHTKPVLAVAISASGEMIVSASSDKTSRRWNSNTGEQIGEPLRGHTDTVWAVAL